MNLNEFVKHIDFFQSSAFSSAVKCEIADSLISVIRGGKEEVYEIITSLSGVELRAANGVLISPADFIARKIVGIGDLVTSVYNISRKNFNPSLFICPGLEYTDDLDILEEYEGEASVFKLEEVLLGEKPPAQTNVLYLTSEAGEGKTHLINYVASKVAEKYLSGQVSKFILPIPLGGRPISSLDDMIAAMMINVYRFPIFPSQVYELVKLGVIVLAFDGLEELFLSDVDRDSARSTISGLISVLKGEGVVLIATRRTFYGRHSVSTRESVIDSIRDWSVLFSRFELCKWSRPMILSYAMKSGLTEREAGRIYEIMQTCIQGEWEGTWENCVKLALIHYPEFQTSAQTSA